MNNARENQPAQGQGRGPRPAQNKDWEKRVADRSELAKKAGAHVLVPTSGVTRMILQIAQQMDVLYQQLSQKSGLFGSVSNEKRLEVELQLVEHLTGMSLTAEKMAKTVGGRARYYHPRELERFLKQTQAIRPAKKGVQAKAKPAPQPVPPAAVAAEDKAAAPVRAAKKVAQPQAVVETPAVVAPAADVPLAATA